MHSSFKSIVLLFSILSLSSAALTAFSYNLLNLHNNARAVYGIPKLAWSDSLAATSQIWANTLARTGKFVHSKRVLTGENLAYGTRGVFTPTRLFNLWMAEKKYFISGKKFPYVSTSGSYKDVGHYTQLIWSTTKKVGCAIASSSKLSYLVCQYQGPGNVLGSYVF